MNKLVTFELAKSLKEKGFDRKCVSFYDLISNQQIDNVPLGNYNLTKQSVSIPTISEVVMWLYEKYGIWISSEPFIKNDNSVVNIYKIFKEGIIDTISRGSMGYDSLTEAYEAAIEYTLNNLI